MRNWASWSDRPFIKGDIVVDPCLLLPMPILSMAVPDVLNSSCKIYCMRQVVSKEDNYFFPIALMEIMCLCHHIHRNSAFGLYKYFKVLLKLPVGALYYIKQFVWSFNFQFNCTNFQIIFSASM